MSQVQHGQERQEEAQPEPNKEADNDDVDTSAGTSDEDEDNDPSPKAQPTNVSPSRRCANTSCPASLSTSLALAPAISEVTFCAIQLEILDDAPDVDIYFNRGKSLEDVFHNLRLDPPAWADANKVMSARKKARGRRQMGEVTVQTFTPGPKGEDAPSVTDAAAAVKGEESKSSSKESTPASVASSASSSSSSSKQLEFVSGNPFVEVTKGVLHLYKENQTTSLEDGVIRSQMLCMLGVPAKIKTPDLLQFIAPCQGELDMMRIITDTSSSPANQFMVLLRFRCLESADTFYRAFNGQPFNSLEPDVCSLVYVSKVETCKESNYYPMASHTELPLCSICLERMDESVSTVLTILCNHTFHSSCLAQWEDFTCPVCRYVQTPEVVAEQRCSDCGSSDDLWICLICGYVGCGRYVGGHSHAHFTETNHCYTMELGQNRVWDYVGDNFVHRLMQTDGVDGKIVETEPNGRAHHHHHHGEGGGTAGEGGQSGCNCACSDGEKCRVGGVPVNSDEKVEAIQLEYTYLLTSQLETQRRYYEEKLARLEEQANHDLEEMTSRARSTVEESKEMESRLASASRDKAKAENKIAQLVSKMEKLNSDLSEEKQMNESLRKNQGEWQKKLTGLEERLSKSVGDKDREIADLKEQVRDLMFFVEAQQKIAESPLKQEIEGGGVAVGEARQQQQQDGAAATRKKNKKKGGR